MPLNFILSCEIYFGSAARHGSDGRRLIGAEQIEDEFIEDIGADNGGKKVHEWIDYRHIKRALSRSTRSSPTE